MLWLVMLLYIGIELHAPVWYWLCFFAQMTAIGAKTMKDLDKEE